MESDELDSARAFIRMLNEQDILLGKRGELLRVNGGKLWQLQDGLLIVCGDGTKYKTYQCGDYIRLIEV